MEAALACPANVPVNTSTFPVPYTGPDPILTPSELSTSPCPAPAPPS